MPTDKCDIIDKGDKNFKGDKCLKCSCSFESHIECARHVPVFSSLNEDELQQVVSLIDQKSYAKNAMLMSVGDIPKDFIIVSNGKIKIFGQSQDGKEQILYILTNGDFFGERNLLHEKQVDYYAQAMEDTLVCTIEKSRFQSLITRFPSISLKIMDTLCDKLEKMESMFKKISPKDVDSRVNMMLLELSQKYGRRRKDGILIELPMNREEMANYIGVARETVSRKITSLRDDGSIKIIGNKKILIIDEKALENSL
ncbi:MAG: Crp/Fnr family transcriptional regulator [Saccharofermentanales bacterium]